MGSKNDLWEEKEERGPGKGRRSRPDDEEEEKDEEEDGEKEPGGDWYKASNKAVQKKIKDIEIRKGKFFKLAEAENIIRICPPWSDEGLFYVDCAVHWMNRRRGVCRKQAGLKCPWELAQDRWSTSEDPAMQTLAANMKLEYEVYFNIVDCKNPQQGVQVWRTTDNMLYKILGFYNDPEYGDFTHPFKGYDLIIKKEGSGLATKYTDVRLRRKPSSIPYKNWRKELTNLGKFTKIPDFETAKKELLEAKAGKRDKPED